MSSTSTTRNQYLAALFAATFASAACAQGPTLTAQDNGDGTASLFVLPDPNFLPAALAAEIAVEISGGAILQSASVGPANSSGGLFDTAIPGDNPFIPGSPIGGDSFGLVDASGGSVGPGDNQIFIAIGSNVVSTAEPINLLNIEFLGSGTLTVAGDLLAGGDVLAQGGGFDAIVNIDPIAIPLIPEPTSLALGVIALAGVVSRRRR